MIEVNMSDVVVGDVVLCEDGYKRTVGQNDIKRDPFLGTLLFGSAYISGYQKVMLVPQNRVTEKAA